MLGSTMGTLDASIANVAMPTIARVYATSIDNAEWVILSFMLVTASTLVLFGRLGDMFGQKRIYLGGFAIFGASSLACALAPSLVLLVVARAVQALGAAMLLSSNQALIVDTFPSTERGRAIGFNGAAVAVGLSLGPIVGGAIVTYGDWRWIFLINVPLAAAVVAISLWHVPESRGSEAKRLDYLGAFVVTVGLGTLIYGLIESPQLGWGHPRVVASLLVAVLCLLSFPLVERRAESPMVPLKLFRSRTFSGANLLTLFLYSALGIFFFIFPMNLIQVQGYSATAAGAAALPLILLMFFLSRWSGGLVTRYGSKLPLIVGPVIAATGFVLFAVPSIGGSYWATFFPAFLILGFGMAVSVAPLTTVVMGAVDQNHAGAASGINNAVARVASLLAIAVFGIVMVQAFASRLDHKLASLEVSAEVRNEMQANRTKLAGIDIPRRLDAVQAQEVKADVSAAFIFAFRVVACSCALLSLASALFAGMLIEGKSAARGKASNRLTAAAD